MENIIKKAIEGGYDRKRALFNPNDASYSLHKMFMDSLFWQSLGKACGWSETEGDTYIDSYYKTKTGQTIYSFTMEMWEYHALRFHEINLTEGWKKAMEYLQEITK